ncbi:HD-GYP domain-containing protein [Methylorubrum sp. SB2]|uniref:HD-GYP domain-containing protein n=1 Tax=Methylorubrum subtropicum TaxID=3138812 RepID=UPI00313E7AEB
MAILCGTQEAADEETMLSLGVILVVSDHPDRSAELVKAVERVADARIVIVPQSCEITTVSGVIVDARLDRPQTQVYLKHLVQRLGPQTPPFLFLILDTSSAALREAQAYGATACLSSHTEPRAIAAALIRLIDPNVHIADLVVQRGAQRTDRLLQAMFRTAVVGTVDLVAAEGALDPVLSAIEEGGLTRWLDVVWEHDDTTFQHSLLVAGLVTAFTQSLGFSQADRLLMARGALMHDLGKAQIPLAILHKPGVLDANEMAVMRTHPAIGHGILYASGCRDTVVLAMTRHHHELLDGSGYPDGLSGEAIADPIRLLTICDIYAALIERRSYKASFSSQEAMRILHGMTGKLEGALVQAFSKAVRSSEVSAER